HGASHLWTEESAGRQGAADGGTAAHGGRLPRILTDGAGRASVLFDWPAAVACGSPLNRFRHAYNSPVSPPRDTGPGGTGISPVGGIRVAATPETSPRAAEAADPHAEYTRRLADRRDRQAACERRLAVLGNARFVVFLAGVAFVIAAFVLQWLAAAW